jgi:hypothetical protein
VSDIVDNRSEKLVDNIKRILGSTESARFAVGYFFLSGLTAVSEKLENVFELKLLIGNTTNRETLEQLAEGYRRLEEVADEAEALRYQGGAVDAHAAQDTAHNLGNSLELMDQTDEGEELVNTLVRMIEEERLKVRVYTKGRLHSKAYIFDYGTVYDASGNPVERDEEGIAIVGSSNFTLSGITHNTELNVIIRGNDNHAQLGDWFDELWGEAEDFDEALMQEMKMSWAMAQVSPYDIYMKALYTLVRDRLEGEEKTNVLAVDQISDQLADFQRVAFRQAVQMIREHDGAFVSDVVGVGKSFIGAAIVKYFEQTERARPLIICPKSLEEMWMGYNETYELNAHIVPMSVLRENRNGAGNLLLTDIRYRDRDFVLVDESHNFRHKDTQKYRILQEFLSLGKRCCFLTATPRNKSAWDIYHQIKLFHQEELTDIPIEPPNLREYFRMIEGEERSLPDLLSNILVRRTRNHLLRWYGYDSETNERVDPTRFAEYLSGKRRAYVIVGGRPQYFPRRELETVDYSIEETYAGLYEQLRGYLGRPHHELEEAEPDELIYARYGLGNYVVKDKRNKEPYASLQRAGSNLRGLIRVLFFKRFESSVHAFKKTVERMISIHETFLAALERGIVPAGEDAQKVLYGSDTDEENDILDTLEEISGKRYRIEDFDVDLLRKHMQHDLRLLRRISELVEPITPNKDAKLQKLKKILGEKTLKKGKRLIFTQYADTAQYLFENLSPEDQKGEVEVIYSGDKSKTRVVGRFAPKANPDFRLQGSEKEIRTLIATDVLAEGLNMQDCDKIVNYDLHWNPVRLIQRFGRIDRIGTEHEKVYGFNFLPETGNERELGLQGVLKDRIREIQETIGEDAAILDKSETLNHEAMYAIYESDSEELGRIEAEDGEEDELVNLTEALELFRQMREDDPEEFNRIAGLRDGIRTARRSTEESYFVFCQAGSYQKLYLVDEDGKVLTRDVRRILDAIRSDADTSPLQVPATHNDAVMRVKRIFEEEVGDRRAELAAGGALSPAQEYVRRELTILYDNSLHDEVKKRAVVMDRAFSSSLVETLQRELRSLRTGNATGEDLLIALEGIYSRYGLHDRLRHQGRQAIKEVETPRVVCSEALISS